MGLAGRAAGPCVIYASIPAAKRKPRSAGPELPVFAGAQTQIRPLVGSGRGFPNPEKVGESLTLPTGCGCLSTCAAVGQPRLVAVRFRLRLNLELVLLLPSHRRHSADRSVDDQLTAN